MGGWKDRMLAKVFTRFPGLAARWAEGLERDPDRVPWTPARRPLAEATVALVTTGGVHLRDQPPFDMADPEGDPSFREIPVDTSPEALTITHDYYDHTDAEKDLNLVLPVERLREAVAAGAVGALHPVAYSFMGHIDGPHVETLRRKTGPEVAGRLARAGVDYALLVPA
ncbi:MAG: hypothetical protein D6708_06060 [Candidatus Dadabacteria bacterium]|nr:MAG: hypothetical protein D6708_06060 [Candidatus Dadabacteria bacterium]